MKNIFSLVLTVAVFALISLSIAEMAAVAGQEDYWVWDNPSPTANDLHGVSALDAEHVWAVGDNGTILFYDGVRWNPKISPTANNLSDVWAVSADDVWAVGEKGTIIHYDGTGWSVVSHGLTAKDLHGISGCDATHLWAVGDSGTILVYGGGLSWGQDGTFPTTHNMYGVTVLDPSHVWCAGGNGDGTEGYIYKWVAGSGWVEDHKRGEPVQAITSLAGGYVWTGGDTGEISERGPTGVWNDYTLLARTYMRGVSALAPDKVFLVGNAGFIYRGPVSGTERFIPVSMMGERLYDVDMLDSLHGWAVGANGTILFHGGIGWSDQHVSVNRDLNGVAILSDTSAWTVGNAGNILHYDGTNWLTQESGTDQDLYAVCVLDSSHVWAVGDNDTMLFYNGTKWSQDNNVDFTAKSISGTSNDFVLAVGGTEIHRYNGTQWEYERPSAHILHGVYAFNQNHTNYAWAVGNDGYALFYNGNSWEEKPTGDPFNRNLLAVYAVDTDHAWAVGAEGTIFKYVSGVWTDESWPEAYNLNSITGYTADRIWVAGAGGTILYYDGSTWQKQNDGSSKLNGISVNNGNIAWAVGSQETILQLNFSKSQWNDASPSHSAQKLLGVSAANDANVWAVGEQGTILYYDGSVWVYQESGTTKDLYGVSAFDASHAWAVGDSGTILYYNGSSWRAQTSGTTKKIYGVAAVAEDGACAVGDDYAYFYNGSGWTAAKGGFNGKGVSGTDMNHLWAVCGNHDVWSYNAGAASWTKVTSTNKNLYGISAITVSGHSPYIWAVGDDGRIIGSMDGGATWGQESSGTTNNLKAVSALDETHQWAVGEKATILFRGTSTWAVQTSSTQLDLYGVSALSTHSVWAVGDKGTYDTVLAAYPGIQWCSPQSVPRGRSVELSIVGGNTHFRQGDSQAVFSGAGITVNKIDVTDPRHATVTITIAGDADCTSRDVNVITGGEVPYELTGLLTIGDMSISKVSPTGGVWGETGLDVTVYGNGTVFDETSVVEFSPQSGTNDIAVNSTSFVSATEVVANIDIASGASEKIYDVGVVTPGEQFNPFPLAGGFTIYDSRITLIDPSSVARGHTVDVEITGYETQFIDGQSTAVFDPSDGITVNFTTVTDATHATANITIDAGAPASAYDVNVTTTSISDPHPLTDGFTVRAPVITSISPTSGVQGQWMAFDVYGEDTAFVNVQSYVTFDPPDGIAIIGTAVENKHHAVVGIIIAEDASTTARTVNVITPCAGSPAVETPQALTDGFMIVSNVPHIDSLSQSSGTAGTVIQVRGYNFGFLQGPSSVKFNGVGATDYSQWKPGEIGVTVPAGASTGPLTVHTIDGTSNGVNFTVIPTVTVTPTPSLTPTPSVTPTPTAVPTATPLPSPTVHPTPEYLVLDSGDYNGDGLSDIAVFRPDNGLWAVRGLGRTYLGQAGNIPAVGDYDGDGITDISVFRPQSGLWVVKNLTRFYFGSNGDIPVPGDYSGSGITSAGIFRPASGLWAVRGLTRVYFGQAGDLPVPGDYAGKGVKEIAIFRPSTGLWAIRGATRAYFGRSGDRPVPGAYRWYASGRAVSHFRDEFAIFRPATGLWAIRGWSRFYFGRTGDTPVIGDFTGNLLGDIGIFRPSSGLWAVRGATRVYFGTTGDIPVTR